MAKHVNNMEKLDTLGVFSGAGGFVATEFGKAWNQILPDWIPEELRVDPAKLARTETFDTETSKMQQALGKAFPGQQSNYELQVVTRALPQLTGTPQGRALVYATSRKATEYENANYKSMTAHAKENSGDLTGWMPLPFPEPPKEFDLKVQDIVSGRAGQVRGVIRDQGVPGLPSKAELEAEARRRGIWK
jgi:hypothetical protein